MKLFHIEEPKTRSTVAVGIDLGTTHTLIAVQQGADVNVLGEEGEKLIPSAVYYGAEQAPIVGQEALNFLAQDSQNVIRSAKRTIGRRLTELKDKEFANTLAQVDNQVAYITQAGIKTPVEVSAEILKKAIHIAEKTIKVPIGGAVITVPAYFDESQRLATKHAAQLAGLSVLRLINEPTAAALAYGLDENTCGLTLVVDLGGGTFDVTLLKMQNGIFQVLATGGDTVLGGDDMDHKVAQWFFEDPQNNKNYDWAQALFQAKQWKEELTSKESIQYKNKSLSRAQFNNLIEPIVHRMLSITQHVIKDADIDIESIEQVILVGGATRTPLVKSKFEQLFNKPLLCSLDPDTVVARGAARLAASLTKSHDTQRSLLLDVLPLSIGIETLGGVVEKILLRNTPIPAIAKETFTTYEDNQTGMVIHIVQGERELASENRSLAQFILKGLPQLPKGHTKVEVTFEISEENLLRVSAKELHTQTSTEIEIKPSYGLTDETISKMLKAAVVHAQEDVKIRQLITKQLEGHTLLKAIQTAIEADHSLLTDEHKLAIIHGLDQLSQVLTKNSLQDIDVAIHNLEEVTNDFMRKRLDKTLESLIQGKTLPDIASELCPK